jgi:ubiquinone/menaquinone biosynthesis C-methylase UbiE
VSSDKRWVVSKVSADSGLALDLGGGTGELRSPLQELGYEYVNVDLNPTGAGLRVKGDAQELPFISKTFDLIVSSETLEHFSQPAIVLSEVHRVLKDEGRLVVWVPFLHPFHGDDYFRYTPLGLRSLMEGAELRMVSLEAPLGLFSLFAQAWIVLLRRVRLGFMEPWLERAAAWLDLRLGPLQKGMRFAAAYLVVSCKSSASATPESRGVSAANASVP